MKTKPIRKMHGVVPLHSYHYQLMRDIDEAEWTRDDHRAAMLRSEELDVKEMIQKGEVWYPLF